jgi:excisionase family DNA binding protein
MNKKEAAAGLGITPRTLERHMSGGRIAYAMRKGRTGEEAFFDAAEVARFGAELRGVTHSPAVVKSEAPTSSDQPRQDVVASPSQALERARNDEGVEAFVSMLADALRAAGAQESGHRRPLSPGDLAHKLALTLPEAAALSGLAANHLREAVKAGKLKARIVGRGWKIRPEDLRAYVARVLK